MINGESVLMNSTQPDKHNMDYCRITHQLAIVDVPHLDIVNPSQVSGNPMFGKGIKLSILNKLRNLSDAASGGVIVIIRSR